MYAGGETSEFVAETRAVQLIFDGRSPRGSLSAGDLLHACALGTGDSIDLYTILRGTTADGRVRAEPSVVAHVGGFTTTQRQLGLTMTSVPGWMARPEFEASSGVRELELGKAEYAAFHLYQSLRADDDPLQGELRLVTWEDHRDRWVEPALSWCVGPANQLQWRLLAGAGKAKCAGSLAWMRGGGCLLDRDS